MVGPMTIITTLITPYMVKIGWKIADALDISDNNRNSNRNNNNKKTWRSFGLSNLFQKKAVIII
jgi:hypothetical protein